MKAIYIYNPHSAPEVALISRAKAEMGGYIELIPLEETPQLVRRLVHATPALIIAEDHLQGDQLLEDCTDSQLLVTAMLYKRLEDEEAVVHKAKTHRLDNIINAEKAAARDELIMDMLDREVL